MQKKRVVIIPSWYPTPENKQKGSYFLEQASFLENDFDIKVLFIELFSFPSKKNIFPSFTKIKEISANNEPSFWYKKLFFLRFLPENLVVFLLKWQYYFAFKKMLASNFKPQLIHAQSVFYGGIVAAFLSKKFNIPFVIIEHNYELQNRGEQLKKEAIHAFTKAQKVAFVSIRQAQFFCTQGLNLPNFEIIPNLSLEHKFQLPTNSKNKVFSIGIVAYPLWIKDMETFFESIQRFSKLVDFEFKVFVLGKDEFTGISSNSKIKALANRYEVASFCTFITELNRNEIQNFYHQLDVLVSTSIFETYGIAVREALLCGIPVVATDSGGVASIINMETGFLVPIKNANAVANAILELQKNRNSYTPNSIRNFVVEKEGKEVFLTKMKYFYE